MPLRSELAHLQEQITRILVENEFVVEPWRGINDLLVDTCTFLKNDKRYHMFLSLRDIGEDLNNKSIGFAMAELDTMKVLHPNTTILCTPGYEEVIYSKLRSTITGI